MEDSFRGPLRCCSNVPAEKYLPNEWYLLCRAVHQRAWQKALRPRKWALRFRRIRDRWSPNGRLAIVWSGVVLSDIVIVEVNNLIEYLHGSEMKTPDPCHRRVGFQPVA